MLGVSVGTGVRAVVAYPHVELEHAQTVVAGDAGEVGRPAFFLNLVGRSGRRSSSGAGPTITTLALAE